MKKINILKSNNDYNRIIQNNIPFKNKEYMIFIEKNINDVYKFGFSVSKKLCGAVNRNRLKRQLKSIIDKNDYQNNFNCIIMIRKSILNCSYEQMEISLNECLKKINIIKKGEKK
ncbi:MAG: ribonuclease P protein component [Bacilli bacterium]